jgi:ectoine hydroxylase-related dioxygenase (phytanoyl-CoA dioxygenase family)
MNCDPDLTYQDVPRLRMVTSDGYLTSGVGYAHHPHRDTWYSAPMTQINWWIPIYPMESESSMAFHPHYWAEAIANGSHEFNYYEWNTEGRANAAQQIKSDTRKQPKPLQELNLDPDVRIVPEPGGMILFSAAQLHSTVANTSGKTRYSIDFRTVHVGDLLSRSGAPNIDSYCTGTSLRDFLRSRDLAPMPEEVVAMYDSGDAAPPESLVFRASETVRPA